MSNEHYSKDSRLMRWFMLFISGMFLLAVPFAMWYTKETDVISGLISIITSPSELVTDYFALGGLAPTFLNAGICGLICALLIKITRVEAKATTLAGYLLVVAHCFYGLNFINLWPPLIGVLVFCGALRKSFREHLHIAFFSTALAPFISELILRYPFPSVTMGGKTFSIVGIFVSILFGLAVGFLVPAILPGTTAMHRGFNMYKAGLAIGILGIFLCAFLFPTMGVDLPAHMKINNAEYYAMDYAYRGFMNCFFGLLFSLALIIGLVLNHKKQSYRALLNMTGYGIDFFDKFGMPLCMINFAIYGFCILGYLNFIFVLPQIFPFLPMGVGFTGPTVGVVFAALTFSADGQHPRNVYPIVLGFASLFVLTLALCTICGSEMSWTLSMQAYINGLAFATGLCPMAGKYGRRIGILAGMVCATICTVTAPMHGGFVLYNGGFTAGLTALVLLPILDYYGITPKYSDDV